MCGRYANTAAVGRLARYLDMPAQIDEALLQDLEKAFASLLRTPQCSSSVINWVDSASAE